MANAGAANTPRPAPLQINELLRAEAFAHPVLQLELRETAISWVVLTGSLAYKIKKPVKFDFIDASTLERRLHYCGEELRLNRRLASDLYLEVVPITRVDGQARVGDGPELAIEYAVRMKQFERQQELSNLLQNAQVPVGEIEGLAEVLGRFHLDAPSSSWSGAHTNTEQMYEAVLGNLSQLLTYARQLEPLPGLGQLVDWTHDAARALEASF